MTKQNISFALDLVCTIAIKFFQVFNGFVKFFYLQVSRRLQYIWPGCRIWFRHNWLMIFNIPVTLPFDSYRHLKPCLQNLY